MNRSMPADVTPHGIRFWIPQFVTASRLVCGLLAILAALEDRVDLAGLLVTIGAVTDAVDGSLARMLKVTSRFGAVFDLYADYVCYLVAPGILACVALQGPIGLIHLLVLGSPLVAGAIRYIRLAKLQRTQDSESLGVPGLPTVVAAFFVVILTLFLDKGLVAASMLRWLLPIAVPVLSALMISEVRYPKFVAQRAYGIPLIVALFVMHFAWTGILGGIALSLGLLYTLVGPSLCWAWARKRGIVATATAPIHLTNGDDAVGAR